MKAPTQPAQTPETSDARPQPGHGAGTRAWQRITGMPGWKRRELGLPAFGSPGCIPHGGEEAQQRPPAAKPCSGRQPPVSG